MADGVYKYPSDPSQTTGTIGTAGTNVGTIVSENLIQVKAVNDGIRGGIADLGSYRNDTSAKATLGGTAGAYTLTTESNVSSLTDGMRFAAIINATNSGASTVNVDNNGSKKIYVGGATLSGGEMLAGNVAELFYDESLDSSAGGFILGNPATSKTLISFGDVGAFRFRLDASDNLILERSTDGVVWTNVLSFANADGAASINGPLQNTSFSAGALISDASGNITITPQSQKIIGFDTINDSTTYERVSTTADLMGTPITYVAQSLNSNFFIRAYVYFELQKEGVTDPEDLLANIKMYSNNGTSWSQINFARGRTSHVLGFDNWSNIDSNSDWSSVQVLTATLPSSFLVSGELLLALYGEVDSSDTRLVINQQYWEIIEVQNV